MRVKKHWLTVAIAVCLARGAGAETITSPSGEIQISIGTAAGLTYSVTAFGQPVIVASPIRMACEKWADIGGSVTMGKVTSNSSDTSWKPVVPGRRAVIRDHYNEMACELSGTSNGAPKLVLRVRAYDDGVAFRCEFRAQEGVTNIVAMNEATEFRFPTDARCWAADYGGYVSHQEKKFVEQNLSGIAQYGFVGLPLVVQENTNLYVAIAEASLFDHAGMFLKRKSGDAGQPVTLVNHTSGTVSTALPHNAPWRLFMIARKPVKFLENDMLLNLNEPCALKDTSWIKPGMMAWDCWWSGDGHMDTQTIKQFIQLSADMGWPYQLIDWTWYGDYDKDTANITNVTPSVDMPEVLRFAKEKGVRCWLWLYWTDADRADAYLKAFPEYEKWGIAGVKIDFMQREDQWMVNWYHKIVECAAEHHLMVDFHGAYKPTGDRRTLPNLVTREGVYGNEWNHAGVEIDPKHKATLAFTRNLLGEMDFTPGGFRNRPQGQRSDGLTQVQGTRCQELALFVVFESPQTCVCDSPNSYKNQPGADFLKIVPTTWDETVGVDGKIGDYIVVAKRKGTDWFLGAMTDWDSRALTVPLDFLGKGSYVATIWRDADDANVNAEHLVVETKTVTSADTLYLFLASGGGTVIHFVPTTTTNSPSANVSPTTWTAYNDLAWQSGQTTKNISAFSPAGTSAGPLRNFATGDKIPVTVTMTGNAASYSGNGSNAPKTSSAGQVFDGKVDCVGYTSFSTGTVTICFDGLTPKQAYSFALFGSRGAANYTNRWTDVQIVGAASFANNSSAGADIMTNGMPCDTARILAANMDGKVWRFDNILPSTAGRVEFIATAGGSPSPGAYLNAFMLQTGNATHN